MADRLVVRGAREHNLRDVDLDLPRDGLIVFTGLSGSGKSSLAFDTIFAEGQRRYVESLSAYARQFLGQMDKPDVDFIDGLSPAVSIDQKATSRNPRSTVGTITEVYDYLRLLFARVGQPHCPSCGQPIAAADPAADRRPAPRAAGGHPVPGAGAGGPRAQGRVLRPVPPSCRPRASPGPRRRRRPCRSPSAPTLKKQEKHTIEVVVDRLAVKASAKRRLTDSVETALGLAGGVVLLEFVDRDPADPERERLFSEHLACLNDDLSLRGARAAVVLVQLPVRRLPAVHRPRHPHGGRPRADRARPDLSLADGAIAPWARRPQHRVLRPAAVRARRGVRFRSTTPWEDLPERARQGGPARLRRTRSTSATRNRYGRERSYRTGFEGAIPFLQRRHAEAESDASRERLRGVHARGALPGLRRRPPQAGCRWP